MVLLQPRHMLSIVTDVEQTKGVSANNELKWAMKEVPAIENEKARKMIESTNMFSNSQKYRCKMPRECIKLEKWTEIVQECV